ncbi:MAG: MmgE/PrpD family protein [Burkholderiales bacterium]
MNEPQTAATRLAARFTQLQLSDIPASSRHAIKRLLLDYLGVAIAGSQAKSGAIARSFVKANAGTAQARLIGDDVRLPASEAAFANAISSHSLELDDIDVLALFHFSPPVYSAALAAAEASGANGEQLLVALAAGCEMMERASRAANNSLRNRGYHTTPTCGVFGAAIAAGKLMALDAEKMVSSLGLAGAQAAGLMEMYGPSMQKRFNPGPAARNGVTAAFMAGLGFTGADTIFEGERGFLRAYTDKSDASRLTEQLDAPYELKIEHKPYSCARPIHNGIDCALDIRKRFSPKLESITAIHIARHPDWAHYHQHKAPRTYHEAQVSLPWSVAVALKDGQALLAQYADERLNEPDLKRLMALTEISMDATLPRGVSCKMSVSMADGGSYISQVDDPKGSMGNPMSDAEIAKKFNDLTQPVIGVKAAKQLQNEVDALERCSDVRSLMDLTAVRGK